MVKSVGGLHGGDYRCWEVRQLGELASGLAWGVYLAWTLIVNLGEMWAGFENLRRRDAASYVAS